MWERGDDGEGRRVREREREREVSRTTGRRLDEDGGEAETHAGVGGRRRWWQLTVGSEVRD